MKINTTPHDATLRFWYVAVPSNVQGDARRKVVAKLKSYGFKPSRHGYRGIFPARVLAGQIERMTGVEMEIGKHDFL